MPGVEGRELRSAVGPSQARKRDQPRGEPGVQHIVVLTNRATTSRTGDEVGSADRRLATTLAVTVPDRDAVPPPELTRDAPVPNALEPLGVVVTATFRDEVEG